MTTGKSDLVDIAVEKKAESEKAILVSDGDRQVWLPKSQCEFEPAGMGSRAIIVTLPEWLAEEKELI